MSNCTEKIKTDECIETRDDSYNRCDQTRDDGYNNCQSKYYNDCHWYSPWNCIAGWFCSAWTWVSNIVCIAWTWVTSIVCVAWKYITKFVCVLVDVITTIINFNVTIADVFIGLIVSILGVIIDLILSIPILGRIIEWILNVIKLVVNAILSIPDAILTLLGIMPEKKLKLLVIIQKDENGKPTVGNLEVVYRDIQYLINTFRIEMNVRVMPIDFLMFKTAFSDDGYTLSKFVKQDQNNSDSGTLDVCCDSCAAGDDLWTIGSRFNLKMAFLGYTTSGRRLFGYGVPIIAFSVRSYTDNKVGCSLGPLSDYITIKFNEKQNGGPLSLSELTPDKSLDAVTDLAHEVGHCCNLPHFDSDNLMQRSPNRTGKLTIWQKIIVRSSRHVTYF